MWDAALDGSLAGADGSILFANTVYFADGKAMPLNPAPNPPQCQFSYSDDGFTETRGTKAALVSRIACDLRLKSGDGHLVHANLIFDVSQPPPVPKPSRDPATDKPQNLP